MMFAITMFALKFIAFIIIIGKFVSLLHESYLRVIKQRESETHAAVLQNATRRKLAQRTFKRYPTPPVTRSKSKTL